MLKADDVVTCGAALLGAVVGGLFTLAGVHHESKQRAQDDRDRALETMLVVLENDFLTLLSFELTYDKSELKELASQFPERLLARLEPLRLVANRSERLHDLLTPIDDVSLRVDLQSCYSRLGKTVNDVVAFETGLIRLEEMVASAGAATTSATSKLLSTHDVHEQILDEALPRISDVCRDALALRDRVLALREFMSERLRRKFPTPSTA